MPVKFKNISSSGAGDKVKFINVSGSGQARFYIPPPEYVTVTIYAKQSGVTETLDLHFSTDGGITWDFAGTTFNSSTCAQIYSDAAVLKGSSLIFRFGSPTNINTVYRHNATFTVEETCPTYVDGEAICERAVATNNDRRYNCTVNPQDSSACPDTTTTTTSTTTTTTTVANYSYGVTYCAGSPGSGDVVSVNALTRFAYYYHPTLGCFTVNTNATIVNQPGLTGFTSITDCNDGLCPTP